MIGKGIQMSDKRKFSVFISSTYEDLKEERQAIVGVALESGFIPIGMEQFHAVPESQWNVITKMIDECDFYLLIIGGRYGSIDASVDKSYTEKEYEYAKSKGLPILVFIKKPDTITEDKKDEDDGKYDKYEKMKRLDAFREMVKDDGNTVDFFENVDELKYVSSQSFKNTIPYADSKAGWVRYKDVIDVINEEAEGRKIVNTELKEQQQKVLRDIKIIFSELETRLDNIENNQLTWEDFPKATDEDIERLFQVDGETLSIIKPSKLEDGTDEKEIVPIDSAFLLVYAAAGNGQIISAKSLSSPVHLSAGGKMFMSDDSMKESVRWQEALDRLVQCDWVKPLGFKGEIYGLTGLGYEKAECIKEEMGIDTDIDPLEEIKKFI